MCESYSSETLFIEVYSAGGVSQRSGIWQHSTEVHMILVNNTAALCRKSEIQLILYGLTFYIILF